MSQRDTGRKVIRGFILLVLFVYSLLGVLFGFFAAALGWPWGLPIALGLLIGSPAVVLGALGVSSNPHRNGGTIIGGAILSSAAFGVFVAAWTTDKWSDLLVAAAFSVLLIGGLPIVIGLFYWRRRPDA